MPPARVGPASGKVMAYFFAALAREYRKSGVTESHFRPFCEPLVAALAAFGGPAPAGAAVP